MNSGVSGKPAESVRLITTSVRRSRSVIGFGVSLLLASPPAKGQSEACNDSKRLLAGLDAYQAGLAATDVGSQTRASSQQPPAVDTNASFEGSPSSDASQADSAGNRAPRLRSDGVASGGALEQFAKAAQLLLQDMECHPWPVVAFYAGLAHERLGKLVEARALYQRAIRFKAEGDGESLQQQQRAQEGARAELPKLEVRIPRLTLLVPDPNGVGVTASLDGAPLPAAIFGDAQLVNPGTHEVAVDCGPASMSVGGPEHGPRSIRVALAEFESKSLSLCMPAEAPKAFATLQLSAPARDTGVLEVRLDSDNISETEFERPLRVEPGRHQLLVRRQCAEGEVVSSRDVTLTKGQRATISVGVDCPAPQWRTLQTVGWVGAGVGAAGLAVAGVTGALAWRTYADSCEDGTCDPSKRRQFDRYRVLKDWSTVSFWVGAPLLVAGTGVLWWNHSRERQPHAEAETTVRVGTRSVLLEGRF